MPTEKSLPTASRLALLALMVPKFRIVLRGLFAFESTFSKTIAELGPPWIRPRLMMVLPYENGFIASEVGPTPVAMTEAPALTVMVPFRLTAIASQPLW